ncbi:MAG: bifunctional phosphoglucose/phosphomannose isomerase [Anaerolineales bacterium]|nr:MAG: bifunctional phosphoglucose/phosphomannose isomerase [Anaerolineales bacterium]
MVTQTNLPHRFGGFMNLDDTRRFEELDPGQMLNEIDQLPDQLETAWELGRHFPLGEISGVQQVILAGMGGSAIGADLLAAYALPMASVPVIVWRDYDLPAFAAKPGTLVVVSSHSGNTEESLSALEAARDCGAQVLAITTGGRLAQAAGAKGAPVWQFEHPGQPRAAVGFAYGLLLAVFTRLGLIPDPEDEFIGTLAVMRSQQEGIRANVPVVNNPAKRMAGQFMGRWPTILGADILEPVARRWRTQIAELAKAVAQFEALPEADHNMVAGVMNPEQLLGSTMVVFLRGTTCHPRNQRRADATRQVMMLEGFNTDAIEAVGETRMAQQWSALHFGDYTAYYLAMAYEVDPTPVEAIEDLKRRLAT